MHWLADERFHDAVGRYVAAETRQVQQYAAVIGEHVPFKAEPAALELLEAAALGAPSASHVRDAKP